MCAQNFKHFFSKKKTSSASAAVRMARKLELRQKPIFNDNADDDKNGWNNENEITATLITNLQFILWLTSVNLYGFRERQRRWELSRIYS